MRAYNAAEFGSFY